MAKNTGKGFRHGAVRGRCQTQTPSGTWMKRGEGGRFMDGKSDGKLFKGISKES